MGHSFVRHFQAYLCKGGDQRVKQDPNLPRSAQISFHGISGRTVDKLTSFDLHSVGIVNSDIVILEIGSTNLCSREFKPEKVGSRTEALMQHLHAHLLWYVKPLTVSSVHRLPKAIMIMWPFLTGISEWFSMQYHTLNFGPTRGFMSQMFPCVRMAFTSISKGNMLFIGVTGVQYCMLVRMF